MLSARELIQTLGLLRHPEGGWFREIYRSKEEIPENALPARFGGARSFSTAIYFLLEKGEFSAFHRIKSDEIWHFYSGSSVIVHVLHPDGSYQPLRLGSDLSQGDQFCAVVNSGCWFGAEVTGNSCALVGCTVAPGFDFADFELAKQDELASRFTRHSDLIRRLTRS